MKLQSLVSALLFSASPAIAEPYPPALCDALAFTLSCRYFEEQLATAQRGLATASVHGHALQHNHQTQLQEAH